MDTLKKYLLNVLVAIDQFFNALFGGDPDETISSRLGKLRAKGHPIATPLANVVDWFFRVFFNQTDHCDLYVEKHHGANGIWKKD